MTKRSPHEGFASLDAVFSILPLMLMLLLALECSRLMGDWAGMKISRESLFRSVSSAADYTVKSGAAVHDGGVRHPNWLDEGALGDGYAMRLRERLGLGSLYIGLEEPETEYSLCIYRLVVAGQGREIRRLFVCGG